MNISVRLAHDTLELIADINRNQSAEGQAAKPVTHMESVETLTALNYGEWMKRIMEQEEDWGETAETLQELVANWMGQYRRRDLRHMAKDWVREPEDRATTRLLELWVTDNDLRRLAQLVTERKFSEPQTPVCFAVSDARRTVKSTLHFVRHDRKLTPREIAQANREMEENRDEYNYFASLITADEPGEQDAPLDGTRTPDYRNPRRLGSDAGQGHRLHARRPRSDHIARKPGKLLLQPQVSAPLTLRRPDPAGRCPVAYVKSLSPIWTLRIF